MSYYLGRSDHSSYHSSHDPGRYSYRPSYGSDSRRRDYSRPSYDSSSSLRSKYSSSSYDKPKTYDFGSSLSSSYGSKYGDSSWRSRDYSSKDYSTKASKDYLSNGNSTEDYTSKDDSTEEQSSTVGNDNLVKDFTNDSSSKDSSFKDSKDSLVKDVTASDSSHKGYMFRDTNDKSSKDDKNPLVKDFSVTGNSSNDYSSKDRKDYLSKYSSSRDYSRKDYLNNYKTEEDTKNLKDDTHKNINGDLDTNMKDFSQTDGISSYKRNKYENRDLVDSTKELSLHERGVDTPDNNKKVTTDEKKISTPNTRKFFNFDDAVKEEVSDATLFAEREPDFSGYNDVESYKARRSKASDRFNGDGYGSSYKPKEKYANQHIEKQTRQGTRGRNIAPEKASNTRDRTSSDSGPVSMHREEIRRFISVVPEENRYVTSVNYLPDRIELRLCGTTPKENKMKKWRSIPDMCNITLKPLQSDDEQIQCEEQNMAYSYDSSNEVLDYGLHKHDHMKEMYVTQYTHYFDPDEPRSPHIAGWKVDVEPNGVPHERSRMCVLKHPVVSGSNRRRMPPRPKSAPPIFSFRPEYPEKIIHSQQVDVVDRGYYTSPRPSRNSDSVFFSCIEDSTDASSLGYAPSDDTSDSSAFFNYDPRSSTSQEPNFSFSKPKLIRLSAEFPGVRNLEKMRRKRQSMGSVTSPRPRSSLGNSPASPRDGEYGFFVALTSGADPPKLQSRKGRSYSHH